MLVDNRGLRLAEADEVYYVGKDFDEARVRGFVEVLEGEVFDAALFGCQSSVNVLSHGHASPIALLVISSFCLHTSSSSRLSMTKKPISSRVSAVNILSGSSPHKSSAAAFIAGATTSRVVFMSSSANHSNTFWICWGFGFCRSSIRKAMPMSLMHPAISRSGCAGLVSYLRFLDVVVAVFLVGCVRIKCVDVTVLRVKRDVPKS